MSDDPARPIPDELVRELERLAESLGASEGHGDLARRFEWLVDLMVLRGHLLPGDRRILARLRGKTSSVQLAVHRDKRTVIGPDIDCLDRMALCRAACCRLTVTLSAEDIEERLLRWELDEPYVLSRDRRTGHCIYCGEGGRCSVYADRPGTCRAYDCRGDHRIWKDFEARIPADGIAELRLPGTGK